MTYIYQEVEGRLMDLVDVLNVAGAEGWRVVELQQSRTSAMFWALMERCLVSQDIIDQALLAARQQPASTPAEG